MPILDDIDDLFRYSHLPADLQVVSAPFLLMALQIAEHRDEDTETEREMRTEAIRDLWAVKNRIVWIAAERKRRSA